MSRQQQLEAAELLVEEDRAFLEEVQALGANGYAKLHGTSRAAVYQRLKRARARRDLWLTVQADA